MEVLTANTQENNLPTPIELEVKTGAQILFIKNDREKRWVNGTLGTIIGIGDEEDGKIYVRTEQGEDVDVEQEVWNNVRYTYNQKEQKVEEEILGSFQQFPLRLAWAITIHKSQGLTFNQVKIDLSRRCFRRWTNLCRLISLSLVKGYRTTRTRQKRRYLCKPRGSEVFKNLQRPKCTQHSYATEQS